MRFFCLLFLATSLAFQVRSQQLTPQSFSAINSPLDEESPVVSPDGRTLYFTVSNHAQNTGGKKDGGDIWISLLLGNDWSAPVNAGTVLNDASYNAVAGFSADGSQLYLLGHYALNGVARSQGIAVSRKTGSGWTTPENISIPYFKNTSSKLSGHVSGDGNVFVFSAESYNSSGAEDIYVSLKDRSGNWSEAKNLGQTINTSLQEVSPWLSDNGRTLYFASNGRKGLGSFDIYASERLDDTWTSWTAPVNLGTDVNTEGRELYYTTSSPMNYVLFTSTLNSDGYGDIKIYVPPKNLQDSTASAAAVVEPQPVPVASGIKMEEMKYENADNDKNRVAIHGSVVNEKTNQPVPATLVFQSAVPFTVTAASDGKYQIRVPSVNEYLIRVEAAGYVGRVEKLDIRTFEMKDLQMNFKLQPIEIGATVNLKNVLFQQSTAILLDESFDELNMVVDFMKTNPKVEIELAGHTDNRGLSVHNMKLSQERVDNVKKYMVSKGVEARRIDGKGYGGIKPIADNNAEETRKLNRRVEFVITKD